MPEANGTTTTAGSHLISHSASNICKASGTKQQNTTTPYHRHRPWPVKHRPIIALERILSDPHTVPHLLDFFEKRQSGQLLFCWMEMEQFKEIPGESAELLLAQGRKIYYKYMDSSSAAASSSAGDANVAQGSTQPTSVLAKLLKPESAEQLASHADSVLYQLQRGCPDRKLFGLCQNIITREIKDVHYAEFLKSASFRALANSLKSTGNMPLESIWSDSRSASLLEAFAVSSCPLELANVLFWVDLERVLFGLSVLWARSMEGKEEGHQANMKLNGEFNKASDGPFKALLDLKACYLADATRTHKATAVSDRQRREALGALETSLLHVQQQQEGDDHDDESVFVAVSHLESVQKSLLAHLQVSQDCFFVDWILVIHSINQSVNHSIICSCVDNDKLIEYMEYLMIRQSKCSYARKHGQHPRPQLTSSFVACVIETHTYTPIDMHFRRTCFQLSKNRHSSQC
jgi:hypothetical protein